MYLKSIEIQGFKSFANKIKLEFHDGFTAIVGPNGSGKSNVADAVRWVLGEQRVKQLRGGSMTDVIFAGTQLRKPLSSAYVAITLDNSDHRLPTDYDEVTVARRLYRSGESEYLINGAQVRLKDVQELFYDTGIGKEGYSIIGQGQIEKILSDKPEDRRELFDEAAGIVKFKRRKAESVKKLENEQANLVRVSDILSELEKQVGPLEQQAAKARIYMDTREALKKLDVNVFLMENKDMTARLDEASRNYEEAGSELEKAQENYAQSKASFEQMQGEIAQIDQKIEEARGRISRASIVRGKLEGDVKVYEEQIRSARSQAEHFHTREEAVSSQLEKSRNELGAALEGRHSIEEEIGSLRKSRDEAAEGLQALRTKEKDLTQKTDDLRAGVLELLNARANIRSRMATLKAKKEQFEVRKAQLSSRLITASSEEAEHQRELERLQSVFEQVCGEVKNLSDQQSDIDRQIQEKKALLTQKDEQMRGTEIEYHQQKSRLDALLNMAERYEGFGGAVKRVMECKAKEPGLVGVVADLIKTEPKYETAIETALGGAIQNVVTTDVATTQRLISMLKRERAGRATFLPLENIRNAQGFNMMGALKEPGVIGLADTLVRIDPAYVPVARSLLGRIVVVDNFDHAKAIGAKFGHRFRMVTLEGDLFNPGGAISGGAFRNSSNLLGRRREIEGLKKDAQELKKRYDALQEEIDRIKEERNLLRAKSESIRTQLQGKFIEQNTARMNIRSEEEKKKASSGNYTSLYEENASIGKTKEELERDDAAIQEELRSSSEKENESNAAIEALQKEISAVREESAAQQKELTAREAALSAKEKEDSFGRQEIDRMQADVTRLEQELKEITDSIGSGSSDIEDRQKKIEETKKTIASSYAEQESAQTDLKSLAQQREALDAQQKKCLEDRDRFADEKAGLDKEVYRLEAQKTRLSEALENQINYMWSEYEITLTDAEGMRDETLTDLPAMKKDISSLKSKIKGLGSVNVGAIEEYAQVKERYTFLKKQHDDIVEAQKSLEQIITELDEAMRTQFKTQFAKIQTEFDKVFKEMFGGGTGRLELVEGEDILEAGVCVIAQPPGKKLQNMMQMSGGEKSLTAISLLFAIQNLKPSPFCLLDEIEAALDESNVVRFAGYLHKLTKNTQFIVITHRRGTMDQADRLYGITMQEKGVSALVSVSLIDDKDLAS
ncbi:MAG: chromosome segregation protein SMC [Lachnospiraceae bacterium]|nr:chromosome segregation protein SMC [Lachnospiraceae bacterium]